MFNSSVCLCVSSQAAGGLFAGLPPPSASAVSLLSSVAEQRSPRHLPAAAQSAGRRRPRPRPRRHRSGHSGGTELRRRPAAGAERPARLGRRHRHGCVAVLARLAQLSGLSRGRRSVRAAPADARRSAGRRRRARPPNGPQRAV